MTKPPSPRPSGPPKAFWLSSSAVSLLSLAATGVLYVTQPAPASTPTPPQPVAAQAAEAPPTAVAMLTQGGQRIPGVLSESDADKYRAIFDMQTHEHWQEADAQLAVVSDLVLKSDVLADRYLHKGYNASYGELHAWLAATSDHPKAAEIRHLAQARRKAGDASLSAIDAQEALRNFGDDNGLAAHPNVTTADRWSAALHLWDHKQFKEAAVHFAASADNEDATSPWENAAACYWAYRAYSGAGDSPNAQRYLARAAEYPRTFYGILARKAQRRALDLDHALPDIAPDQLQALYTSGHIRRAVALTQVGQEVDAEQELRLAFTDTPAALRAPLLTLSAALALPSVQMNIAQQLRKRGEVYDAALYPTPGWQPAKGYAVDPALLFAIARQESGFRHNALSPDGARGVMQLMPATAAYVQRMPSFDEQKSASLFEPVTNIAVGQSYLRYLMDNTPAGTNLVYLTAAYNAGPGKLSAWITADNDDPLLFIERIPYAETRHYVMQVLTNYWIYQELQGRSAASASALAQGQWPEYKDSDWKLADNATGRAG